jgi:DNA-binding CsgD family transcriptional regulator
MFSANLALDDLLVAARNDASAWASVCDAIAEQFRGIGAALLPADGAKQGPWNTASRSILSILDATYRGGWTTKGYRPRLLQQLRNAGFLSESDVLGARLRQEPYFREILETSGFGGGVLIYLPTSAGEFLLLVECPADWTLQSSDLGALVAKIRPALLGAIEDSIVSHAARMATWKGLLSDTLGAFFIVDPLGTVVDEGGAASRYLSQGLSLKAGRLASASDEANGDLQVLLAAASRTNDGAVLPPPAILHSNSDRSLSIDAVPLPQPLRPFHFAGAALVRVREVVNADFRLPALLRSQSRLTPSEIRLAMALYDGVSILEYAQQYSLAVGTVRQQSKSIFRKTKTGRQAELVSWMRHLRSREAWS